MSAQIADVLVMGGLLVSGDNVTRADVLISDGGVREVGPDLSGRDARRVIDAAGRYILPGGIDSHAHPVYGDKMDTFSMCAAYGGVTTIVAFIGSETHRHERFGNTWGLRKYNPDIVKGFIEYAEQDSYTDFAVHGLVTMRDQDDLDQVIPDLVRMGVISYKVFMTWNPWVLDSATNDLAVPDEMVMRVMELAAHNGGLPMVHAENGCCKAYLETRHRSQGMTSIQHYLDSAPNILESEAVNRAAVMAQLTGSPLYPVHLSAREVVPVLERYTELGLPIFGETCPHYLTLTNDDLPEKGYRLKVAPPLRQNEDQDAMWQGLATGVLNTIGSDFTGYTRALKLTGSLEGEFVEPEPGHENIFEVAAGLSTLEHMMPVVWTHGVNTGRITMQRFVQVFSENPAKIFGIWPQKGALQPGSDADLIIWDPAKRHVVGQEHGISDLSTFEGMELLGMPVMTMVRGEVVVDDGRLVGKQGTAQYVRGDPNATAYAPGGPNVS